MQHTVTNTNAFTFIVACNTLQHCCDASWLMLISTYCCCCTYLKSPLALSALKPSTIRRIMLMQRYVNIFTHISQNANNDHEYAAKVRGWFGTHIHWHLICACMHVCDAYIRRAKLIFNCWSLARSKVCSNSNNHHCHRWVACVCCRSALVSQVISSACYALNCAGMQSLYAEGVVFLAD